MHRSFIKKNETDHFKDGHCTYNFNLINRSLIDNNKVEKKSGVFLPSIYNAFSNVFVLFLTTGLHAE